MTLDSYLVSKGITEPAFAAMVGLNQSTVNRLRKGSVPSPNVMRRILDATSGAVTPNDFFGLQPQPRRRAQVSA
ncbi:helix-turn-helix domain-containing protein [Sphingomonas sp. SAFR-052]|uniref:helix-turn-helix domain-containing protein n=1 Tax=Sphingomonas sp. SAFR-052 TaxID=3436867 RepID=UPI003F80E377